MLLPIQMLITGALLRPPPTAGKAPHLDRRAMLQVGGGLCAAALVPPAHAESVVADPLTRFEVLKKAALSAGVLKGRLDKYEFEEDKLSFLFTTPKLCSSIGDSNRFLSVRTWLPTDGNTATDIVKTFKDKFAATEKGTEGFKLYFGGVITDGNGLEKALFLNIFETAEEAERINEKAVVFGQFGPLAGKATLVDKVTGTTTKTASFYACI